MVGFIRVKGDRCGSLPVADVAGPTFRMRLSGRRVDGFALLQDDDVLATVALAGGYETDAAMTMLLVVPANEAGHPGSGVFQALERPIGKAGAVLAGLEQRL